ncbi:ShET2/EspL2 family type III secretion system effector toxin [Endozoicomonas sp. GU-1]|uniref:ShET2/EspL2 family type III secretion system effector toxin n=1 Tax=Endozoicomonas sp. GU-1 TaxID=3009078 RepID=UPI0022B5E06A|nr:ShET2/EspL2 family type III secretion system effector toxin [Endozoicomonas sp. GU-1]WBA81687.1 ShET2/EspL2 family type III secretion system effector toxin [Endozoicomonas sp. GU-1]WBA84642.1 ShET2/EspL2 family type III secretion system effector toxin [Endozoicomonas sp. GU-1]
MQYFSKGEFENFNCEVNNTVSGDMIACRHLAYAFATGEFGTKEAGKFSYIDTLDKISQHSGIKEDCQMPNIFRSHTSVPVREAYYFGLHEVGVALQVALEQQKSEGHEEKSYLFFAHRHAMALRMQCLPGEPEIKVSFYDPNDTLRVRRLIVSDQHALKKLSIRDLMPDLHKVVFHFPKIKAVCCYRQIWKPSLAPPWSGFRLKLVTT